jgi:hypothetical protein
MRYRRFIASEKIGYASVFGCRGCEKYKDICTVCVTYEENKLTKIDQKKFTLCMEYTDDCMNKYITHME